MSREEAIKELTELLPEEFLSEYAEAIRMGIEALQQEPCEVSQGLVKDSQGFSQEPCGDCISRESIIEIVNHQRFGMSKLAFGIITEKVKELPSVTPQQKMGSSSENPNKWIPVSERLPEEAGMYLCSYDYDYVDTSYFDISMNEFNIFHEQVTAWMPMPTPYQSEIQTEAEGSDK